jgi:hypothetical protein
MWARRHGSRALFKTHANTRVVQQSKTGQAPSLQNLGFSAALAATFLRPFYETYVVPEDVWYVFVEMENALAILAPASENVVP